MGIFFAACTARSAAVQHSKAAQRRKRSLRPRTGMLLNDPWKCGFQPDKLHGLTWFKLFNHMKHLRFN
jgi:hypothetical protein